MASNKVENNAVFNFKKEMHEYCSSDVKLLRQGIMSFRNSFMEKTDNLVDPLQCVTIASAVMKSYRVQLLEKDTIAMVYNDNVLRDIYSKKSIIWLEATKHFMEENAREEGHNETYDIKHARNGGEQSIRITKEKKNGDKVTKVVKVDGYNEEDNVVFQFHGCFWHGCENCFKDRSLVNPVNKKTMRELYAQTMSIENDLKTKCKVVSIWECEYEKKEMQDHINDFMDESGFKYNDVLNPRDAFMGGRTNACCLKYDCTADEEIFYVDFTSLYPYINKYGEYPIGHPTIIKEFSDNDISRYHGVIKCVVLPPKNLYHPVLPTKKGLKLMFGLCNMCMKNNTQVCTHSEEQRAITGTWTHLELNKALEKGYKILELHEVHHFEEMRTGLYEPFVNKWLKIKQESSGWPSNDMSEIEKNKYIADYLKHENIQLTYDDIDKNPGRRATAKLILNSFWGKLGQRDNMAHDVYFDDPAKYFKLLTDSSLNISVPHIVCEDSDGQGGLIHVSYTSKASFVKPAKNTNVYHAIFTTSQARLKLFGVMDALGERVLYHDTDSIIGVKKKGEKLPCIELGNYLGDLTNEIDPEDGYITNYRAAGPKDYSYKTSTGKTCVKVKGFTLNYEAGQIVNMDSMLNLIDGHNPNSTEIVGEYKVPIMEFVKDKKNSTIKTNYTTKEYKFQYDTRVIDWETYKTYPYGYVE
jgi:hypothetical protein